ARLPRSAKAQPPPAPLQPESLEGLPVLVVDDNATNRHILREMLANWHMKPVVAEGGAAALAELQRAADRGAPFALVLLDALMPGMDGFSVAEQIRRRPGLVGPRTMWWRSAHPRGAAARCRGGGGPRSPPKPLKHSALLDATPPAPAGAPAAEPPRQDAPHQPLPSQPSQRFRVLL